MPLKKCKATTSSLGHRAVKRLKTTVRCFVRDVITISQHSEVADVKKKDKKEIKYLNVCMDKALHEEFDAFCKAHGMSKVGATELAIRQYMDKMNKAFKNVK